MYELFVLGELMTGEKHGYMLQDVLKNAVGLGRKISSGTLYPLLSRMTESGWINLRVEEETKGGRTRKIYEITEAGRDRFQLLIAEPLDFILDAETQNTFRFKMVYFQYVDKEVRLACLKQYLLILERSVIHVLQFESRLLMQKPEPEKQRVQLLRVFDHRKRLGEVEIEWIKEEIERVRTQQDE
ncbi:PadR family transcriptional regulator [Paenibacillus sp. FSL H7-0331]|uniref:PadR family transcriptional regulator n=1 Tax=Paenibacillus sp. FSL H7-0331 TaxID=1920421 RepID=UPI00096FB387|nr:PadR family transcriptional regulator [Paenibacillus sp. FSL H7-0331]OMF11273.1 PadR family transcriptional regulator [Paenibacillus sp. FSL H7-0331]